MRFQSTAANCGPAVLRNALLCHGITRSEEELEALTGCTAADGTNPKGMLKALAAIARENPQISPRVIAESREDVALLKLVFTIQQGSVVIMCADNAEHWTLAFGLLGSNIIHMADSADSELVQHLRPDKLLARWKGPGRKAYYGIVV